MKSIIKANKHKQKYTIVKDDILMWSRPYQ